MRRVIYDQRDPLLCYAEAYKSPSLLFLKTTLVIRERHSFSLTKRIIQPLFVLITEIDQKLSQIHHICLRVVLIN